jgi:hypothetical protein
MGADNPIPKIALQDRDTMNLYDAITVARKLLAEQAGMYYSKGKWYGSCSKSRRYAEAYNCLANNHLESQRNLI